MKEWEVTFNIQSFLVGIIAALIWQDVVSDWWAACLPLLLITPPWGRSYGVEWSHGSGWRWIRGEAR